MTRIAENFNSKYSKKSDNGYAWLESLLENFCIDNPGSIWDVDKDGHRMTRAFLLCSRFADVALTCNLRFYAVDSGFMQKNKTNGLATVLECVDSNRNAIPMAVGIFDKESTANFNWFFRNILKHPELAINLNSKKTIIYSDRGKGLRKSIKESLTKSRRRACFLHILRNLLKNKLVSGGYKKKPGALSYTFGDIRHKLWALQAARTSTGFKSLLNDISKINPEAGIYLGKINPKLFAEYTLFESNSRARGYLYSTSNIVEQEMWRLKRLGIRFGTPYEFFEKVINLWTTRYAEGVEKADDLVQKEALVTDYAYRYFKNELEESYKINARTTTSGEVTYFIESPTKKSTSDVIVLNILTDYMKKLCTCGLWFQMGIICRHALANARMIGVDLSTFDQQFVDHCFIKSWHATSYCGAYKASNAVRLSTRPLVKKKLLPMTPVVINGRPRLNRFPTFGRRGNAKSRVLFAVNRRLTMLNDDRDMTNDENYEANSVSTDNFSDCGIEDDDDDDDDDDDEATAGKKVNMLQRKKKRPVQNKDGTPQRVKSLNAAHTPESKQDASTLAVPKKVPSTKKLPIPLVLDDVKVDVEEKTFLSSFWNLFGYKN